MERGVRLVISLKTQSNQAFLVEAGGIEPPSEGSPAMATTRLVRDLELAQAAPTDVLSQSQPVRTRATVQPANDGAPAR